MGGVAATLEAAAYVAHAMQTAQITNACGKIVFIVFKAPLKQENDSDSNHFS